MATLADVIKKKRSGGQSRTSSFFGSLKDKLKETIDPRQLIDQTGILTALFPSLKAFKAKGVSNIAGKKISTKTAELISSSAQSSQLSEIDLSVIAINTEIAAKNTMVLPNLSRDVNVMRQNISKLVKASGQKAETKADAYFKKSKDRESDYEKQFGKKTTRVPTKVEKDESVNKDDSKSKGFLSLIGKLITGLIGAVVSAVKFVIGSLVGIIKSLITTLITGITSLIKTIFTTIVKLVAGLLAKIGSTLLKAIVAIKNAIPSLLERLLGGVIGRNLFTGLLTSLLRILPTTLAIGATAYGGYKLGEYFINQDRAYHTQNPELRSSSLKARTTTVTPDNPKGKGLKETYSLDFVNGMLNDSANTDEDLKKEFGVSREVLEAYRDALYNRDLLAKNRIPVPNLSDIAKSFGEKIEKNSPEKITPVSNTPSREESDIRSALEKEYIESHQTAPSTIIDDVTGSQTPASSAVTNLTQNFNNVKKIATADSTVTVIPSTSATNNIQTSSKKTVLPDVFNVDYPIFGNSQIFAS